MKLNEIKTKIAAGIVGLLGTVAWASPITPVARTVIPSEVGLPHREKLRSRVGLENASAAG